MAAIFSTLCWLLLQSLALPCESFAFTTALDKTLQLAAAKSKVRMNSSHNFSFPHQEELAARTDNYASNMESISLAVRPMLSSKRVNAAPTVSQNDLAYRPYVDSSWMMMSLTGSRMWKMYWGEESSVEHVQQPVATGAVIYLGVGLAVAQMLVFGFYHFGRKFIQVDGESSMEDNKEDSTQVQTEEKTGSNQRSLRWYHIAILIMMKFVGGAGQDAFVPNMPGMMLDLKTTATYVGLTLQLNWIMMSIGAVVLGNLSDKYGRRPIVVWALLVFTLSNVGCALSSSISLTIFCRCVSGFGEAMWTMCEAITRDAEEDVNKRAQLFAIIDSVGTVSFLFAPGIGGILGGTVGWRYVFIFLAMFGFVTCLCAIAALPETVEIARASPSLEATETNVEDVDHTALVIEGLKKSKFVCACILFYAIVTASLAAASTNLPFVLEMGRGWRETQCSMYMISWGALSFFNSLLVAYMLQTVHVWKIMKMGFVFMTLCCVLSLANAALSKMYTLPMWLFALPNIGLVFGVSQFLSPARAITLQLFGSAAGTAVGFIVMLQLALQTIWAFVQTHLTEAGGEPAWFMCTGVMLLAGLLMWAVLVGTKEPEECKQMSQETPAS